ncbi:MAG: hypothetical protein H7Y13_08195 [Sphingobacteriaceae bacterium]|nr:hypothetical protein [Sphingobacteriaceae bacterium]
MTWPAYLIQVNIYLILFYLFYILVLKNETFFKWNRIFLVSAGVLSFLIPLMQSDWIKAMFVTEEIKQVTNILAITPARALQKVSIDPAEVADQSLSLTEWIALAYLAGVVVYLTRFFWQLYHVSKSFRGSNQAQSFFKSIRVAEDIPSRESILKHETVHADQLHSADVIFFELVSILNWFNPVVYGYKKSVRYIHEFIADDIASKEKGKADYALLLVSNVFGVQKVQLSNNFFNQSLLKKRIEMLYKTKSRRTALLKYGLSAPMFAIMLVFSSAMVITPEKAIKKLSKSILNNRVTPKLSSLSPKQLKDSVKADSIPAPIIVAQSIDSLTLDRLPIAYVALREDSVKSIRAYDMPNVRGTEATSIISRVEITDQFTIVTFEHTGNKGGWIQVNKSMHLDDGESFYKLKKIEGIPIAPLRHGFTEDNEKLVFKLYFEKLPPEIKKVDIIERPRSNEDIRRGITFFNYHGVRLEK